jgi:hypothetical protein
VEMPKYLAKVSRDSEWNMFPCLHVKAFIQQYQFCSTVPLGSRLDRRACALVESHWNKRGLYTQGMRKLAAHQLKQESRWRAAMTKRAREDFKEEQLEDIMVEYKWEQLTQPKNREGRSHPTEKLSRTH